MKVLTAEALAHVQLECTTTAICWLVELHDGMKIRGTDHDMNIDVPLISSPEDELEIGGVYYARANISGSNMKSAADMSVDNMEVEGAVGDQGGVDLTIAQLESGVADKAPVTLFLVNWSANPVEVICELRRGYLGETVRDTDGSIKTEVRGMTQPLSQNICQTYAVDCNVIKFGDARCKYPVASITRDAEITTVVSKRQFVISTTPGTEPGWLTQFYNGEIRILTGPNTGFIREVKRADWGASLFTVELWDPLPITPTIGDTMDFVPGCDRSKSNCKLYGNVVNFRGHGVFIPGMAALMKGPK